MPRRDGTGPVGQGPGRGKEMGAGKAQGRGRGRRGGFTAGPPEKIGCARNAVQRLFIKLERPVPGRNAPNAELL
jgi:hypothetical protein